MSAHGSAPRRTDVPGESGLWAFLLADMTLFACFFGVILFYRADDPELFRASQAQLNQGLGAVNTILLLTSSLFVVHAVGAVRRGAAGAPRLLAAAIACGVGFVAVKAVEWGEKFDAGISVTTNDFFVAYFMFTGFHLVHVLLGIAVLVGLRRAASRPSPNLAVLEGGASYWHMVDLLWVVLFPLLYLLH